MKKIIFASSNTGKIRAVSEYLAPLGFKVIPQTEFNVPNANETGLSFIENAILKARNSAKFTNLPALADDSGLCIHALNNAPGIYSARFSGEHGNDETNIDKVLMNMRNIKKDKRQAQFQCALVFIMQADDPAPFIAEGKVNGMITHERLGNNGFGYDPIFFLPEYNQTMAEMENYVRNKVNHRALALDKLKTQLLSQL